MNERINELLKHSIKSEGIINLFSDVKSEFSLFDPKFLEEVANMKAKNLAVELLKKLIFDINILRPLIFRQVMLRNTLAQNEVNASADSLRFLKITLRGRRKWRSR